MFVVAVTGKQVALVLPRTAEAVGWTLTCSGRLLSRWQTLRGGGRTRVAEAQVLVMGAGETGTGRGKRVGKWRGKGTVQEGDSRRHGRLSTILDTCET